MKKLYFIFLLFIHYLSFAQSDTNSTWPRYYQLVHKAEVDIVDKNKPDALQKYAIAFNLVDTPFGKDYYNAMVCAVHLNKEKIVFSYLSELCSRGYQLSFLPITILDKLKLFKTWNKFNNNLPKLEIIHKKNVNAGLIDTLLQLDFDDQKFRKLDKNYTIYKDTINKIDTINYRIFKKILAQYGIPNEKTIGIHAASFIQPCYGLIRHYTGDQNQPSISSILKKEVMKGRFNPKFFGWIESVKNFSYDYYGTKLIVIIDNRKYLYNYNEELRTKINKNRLAIGLESLEDLLKKIQFEENDKEFKFCLLSGKSIFDFADDYSKQRFLLSLTEMK